MRRLALLAALAFAVLAAPAAAQDAEPIVGAGSFTTAPIIEPGTYSDTALPEEYLYYAVRLAPGQRLRVELQAGMPVRELNDLGVISVQLNIHSPDRSKLSVNGRTSTVGNDTSPAEVTTGTVLTSEEARTANERRWTGPGVYFIAVYPIAFSGREVSRAQIPIQLTVAVEGEAQPDPTPSATPSPAATATLEPPRPSASSEDDDTPMVAAAAGVGGLLVGVVGVIALRQRRR